MKKPSPKTIRQVITCLEQLLVMDNAKAFAKSAGRKAKYSMPSVLYALTTEWKRLLVGLVATKTKIAWRLQRDGLSPK